MKWSRVGWIAQIARLVVVVLAGSLFVSAVGVAIAPRVWGLVNAHDETPVELPTFTGIAQRSVLFDRSGRQIGAFQVENSQPITIDQVPDDVVAAVLAVEDANFFGHDGVNLRALVRAMLSNFESGSARQGASTITQQVVKNEYLAGLERDGRYKILQARYAVLLERSVGKRQILERYLNTVFLGNNAYGLQAAAEVYFGTDVENLTIEQGTFLAGMIQAPSSYDPIRHPERARQRFAVALRRVAAEQLITDERAEELAASWPLPEVLQSVPQRAVDRTYFSEAVKDYLLNKSDILGATYQERFNALFRGGLRIYTTLDTDAQAAAEAAVKAELPANKAGFQGALLSLDTATGGVRAMVGGPGFQPGREEVNMTLRRRQTGSSIKIFVLAAALQAGVEATDLIDGTLPCTLPNPGNEDEPFEIEQGVSRSLGSVEEMTWYSINCAYSRLAQIVGLNRVVDTTYRMTQSMFLTRDSYKIQPYASFATGANEMSPLDMASGAQTIANGGVHMQPFFVERIEGSSGVVYEHNDPGQAVFSKEVADKTVAILKGVMTSGTARRSALDGERPSAGKTGTQDDNTNAWFVGMTPQLTTAVWVGDPKAYTPMVNIPEFVAKKVPRVQGGTFPAAIWKTYTDRALASEPALDWDAPQPVTRSSVRLYLPGVDCLAQLVSGTLPKRVVGSVAPAATTTTTTSPGVGAVPPPVVSTTQVTVVESTVAAGGRPVVSVVDGGTTVLPSNTNPFAPVPSVDPNRALVFDCAKNLPGWVQTTIAGG
jgi:penicillin-binding protein 1A